MSTTGADRRGTPDHDLPGNVPGKPKGPTTTVRVLVSAVLGLVAGAAVAVAVPWVLAVLIGWMVGAATFIAWLLGTVWPMDALQTAKHAVRDDANRGVADLAVLAAAVASLGAVALMISGGGGVGKDAAAALSVGSVALAWTVVHTLFTTRYARLYYEEKDGGIDFNGDDPPDYQDFAYVAFTIGMTFQVSDNDFTTKRIRRVALRHALLAYVFGALIVAMTINLVAGLAK